MKKLLVSAAALMTLAASLSAQSFSITNIFGADSDSAASSDFLIFDKDWNKQAINLGNRSQLDFSSEKVDSRIRFDFANTNLNGKDATTRIRGYVNVKPFEFLNFVAGNNFFSKFQIPSAYLQASDDVINHGKLTDDNGYGFIFSMAGVKLAASLGAQADVDLNLGASYLIKDIADFGFTAQDLTEDSRSFSVYAGLGSVKNLKLGLGYTYNYNNSSYLASTQNAIQFSTAYAFEQAPLTLALDYEMGFNNVLGDGSGAVYSKDLLPVYGAVRTNFKASDSISLALFAAVKTTPLASSDMAMTVYPYLDFKTACGTVRTGARVQFTEDNFASFSIPLTWTYKFSK